MPTPRSPRRTPRFVRAVLAAAALTLAATGITAATAGAAPPLTTTVAVDRGGPAPGTDDPRPAPPAVADYYPVVYAQQQIMPAARVDTAAGTVTLPLHQGRMRDGRTVWFVVTDASDRQLARRYGANYSAKLANAPAAAVRTASLVGGTLVFDRGAVDFAPERRVAPGPPPHAFPPTEAVPGSVGDGDYSPLVRVRGTGAVLNATIVAFDVAAAEIEFPNGNVDHAKVIDRATAISPARRTVTFATSPATAAGRAVLFISLDSNSPLVSALEATTYAPRLSGLPVGTGNRPGSAVSANYVVTNGPTGAGNPLKQGLDSALSDPGAQVLDVFGTVPGVVAGDSYSPMWDLQVSTWSDAAVAAGHRTVLHGELDARAAAARGDLTNPDGTPLSASGLISNCTVLVHF